jgi:hypothetical protein
MKKFVSQISAYNNEQNPHETESRSAAQEIPAFYGTKMFIIVVKLARHWHLS